MKNNSHKHKALQSLQFLRGKAHARLKELFPDKKDRYAWLKRHAPKMHMSEASREELNQVISKLETLRERSENE